jgi:hypothetical protein
LKNILTEKEHKWVVVQNLQKNKKEQLFGDEQKQLKTTNKPKPRGHNLATYLFIKVLGIFYFYFYFQNFILFFKIVNILVDRH